MKVVKDQMTTLKRRRRVTVELDHGEELMSFRDNQFYKLGGQVEDVVAGHVITAAERVTWCSVSQEWV